MNKIDTAFENNKTFVEFLAAGDPSLSEMEGRILEMEEAGAAVIEIGIPFSDPVAECEQIQEANVRALAAPGGCTTDMIFDAIEKISPKVQVPLVIYTYLNPVFRYGYEAFCNKCAKVGISGIIVPDMPYEEKEELRPIAEKYELYVIPVAGPATKERIHKIAKEAKGYLHVLPAMDCSKADEVCRSAEEIGAAVREVSEIIMVAGMDFHEKNGVKIRKNMLY